MPALAYLYAALIVLNVAFLVGGLVWMKRQLKLAVAERDAKLHQNAKSHQNPKSGQDGDAGAVVPTEPP